MIKVYDTAISIKAKQAAQRTGLIDRMMRDSGMHVCEDTLAGIERLVSMGYKRGRG
jgi:hypothetical protein